MSRTLPQPRGTPQDLVPANTFVPHLLVYLLPSLAFLQVPSVQVYLARPLLLPPNGGARRSITRRVAAAPPTRYWQPVPEESTRHTPHLTPPFPKHRSLAFAQSALILSIPLFFFPFWHTLAIIPRRPNHLCIHKAVFLHFLFSCRRCSDQHRRGTDTPPFVYSAPEIFLKKDAQLAPTLLPDAEPLLRRLLSSIESCIALPFHKDANLFCTTYLIWRARLRIQLASDMVRLTLDIST